MIVGRSFGLLESTISASPVYLKYNKYSVADRYMLVKAKLLGYSLNTFSRHLSYGSKIFSHLESLPQTEFPPREADVELFLIELAKSGHSYSSVEGYLASLNFVLTFFGYESVHVKNIKVYLSKSCPKKKIERQGFQKDLLTLLWKNICKKGGVENLSMKDLRSFTLLNICYYT